jgi:Cdc25 family phosphatase
VNIPSERFHDDADADAIVAQLRGHKRVVFHCMFSQQRGPFCAARFAARLRGSAAAAGGVAPQVLVLHGGWRSFSRAFGGDATLTEGVDW